MPPPATATDNMKVLVIGQNVWGRGDTLKEALKKAQNPKEYQAFICDATTFVDVYGRVSYPLEFMPKEIHRKGKKEFVNFSRET